VRALALAALLLAAPFQAPGRAAEIAAFAVTGDAILLPLGGHAGDAARGEATVRDRETGNCLICHSIPVAAERFQGDLAPPLAGVGSRLTAGQIRLRLVDPTLLHPQAIMPAYHRVHGLLHVDPRYTGRPILTARDIEDVVAYLVTLKEP
jgi:sulfur-oxidizing protein SoxX